MVLQRSFLDRYVLLPPTPSVSRYLVTHLMGADLNNIVKCQKLTDDHVQFLIYQILRGLKVQATALSFITLSVS